MKTALNYIACTALASTLACDADGGDTTAISEDDASRIAEEAVGGDTEEVERSTEGETEVWEVHLAISNGAMLEVKVDVDSGDVVVVEDKTGPFDYPDFTPTDGVLSYEEMKATALEEVAGDIEAWEFKREEEDGAVEFEYEFYIRDADAQLWEIKFDAVDGMATELEPKDMVDP